MKQILKATWAALLLLTLIPVAQAAGPSSLAPPPWIKEHWMDLDLNHDYTLTWTEFQSEMDTTFLGYDSDHNGQLSTNEYGADGHHSVMAGYLTFHSRDVDLSPSNSIITMAELTAHGQTLFDAFDANLDGKITAIEFAALTAPRLTLNRRGATTMGVRMELRPEASTTYKVMRSTNLSSWLPIAALTATNQGSAEVVVTNSASLAYYQVMVQDAPSITQGLGTTTTASLGNFPGGRPTKVGSILSSNGITWTLPAATSFTNATKATDLHNTATGVTPPNLAAVNLNAVPVIEVDADGTVITGYLFADNYFELYVNGKLVAVDPVPYTPFNSSVVRFKAKAPITYAIRLVDWEENLGIGSETNGGSSFFPGDGGLIASFSDGTVTGSHWKAQTFYISPLTNPAVVSESLDGTRSSPSVAGQPINNANSYALHYLVPTNWYSKTFSDGGWPAATTFSEATAGVDDKPAFTNFRPQFTGAGAQFIWSSNLILDNEVLVRYTTP